MHVDKETDLPGSTGLPSNGNTILLLICCLINPTAFVGTNDMSKAGNVTLSNTDAIKIKQNYPLLLQTCFSIELL